MSQAPLITVVLATYNWPEALDLCLQSLQTQTDHHFEICIADDGSKPDTTELITQWQTHSVVPIRHFWQEDQGFRKSRILNQAIAQAQGEYLVFLDGDCIAQPDFIARHRALATTGFLVTGARILLSAKCLTTQAATMANLFGGVSKAATWPRGVLMCRASAVLMKA